MQSENNRKRSRRQERRLTESAQSSAQVNQKQPEVKNPSKRKEQKRKQKEEKRKQKKPRRRIFPIWLRIILIIIGCIGAVVTGVMVGYGILGDGVPNDALLKETWQHIIDIVKKEN